MTPFFWQTLVELVYLIFIILDNNFENVLVKSIKVLFFFY